MRALCDKSLHKKLCCKWVWGVRVSCVGEGVEAVGLPKQPEKAVLFAK